MTTRQLVLEKELEGRLDWLILLRWFAGISVFCVITGVRFAFQFHLLLLPLYLGNAILLLYNSVFCLLNKWLQKNREQLDWFGWATRFANTQIALDLVLLTYFIYFTGGVENPFIFYFVFHMVIASISLSNQDAYRQAGLAVGLMVGVTVLERIGRIPHHHLDGFLPREMCQLSWIYPAGELFVFATALFLIVFMTTSIVNRVREGEEELMIANQKLAAQDKLKSEYVLKVSHDIQSHLSTIQSCVDVVLNGFTGDITEKSRGMLQKAFDRSGKLIKFVKDLLDLSRMRAMDQIEKERLPLREHIERVLEQHKLMADEKQHTIHADLASGIDVMANYHALEELLGNLISNAIRYTPPGGQIDVKMEDHGDHLVLVSVKDSGIGIPEEALPHIFEDFYRAKNAIRETKSGTGLGMAIVKKIIESHNGTMCLESQVGKGTTFTFTLPKVA